VPAKDPALKRFGDNVRARREAQELSQEQLAERADLDRTYISGVARGVRNIGLQNVVRIAHALQSTTSELCVGIEQ
jgi:transcriptional regulator with XRE-family HTH domain